MACEMTSANGFAERRYFTRLMAAVAQSKIGRDPNYLYWNAAQERGA